MIEQQAIVTRSAAGQIWVKSQHNSACGGCAQLASCGTASLSKLLPQREMVVHCELNLQAGDQVRVVIDDAPLLLGSLLLYLVPILLTLLVVILCEIFVPVTQERLPEIALSSVLTTLWLIHRRQNWLLSRLKRHPVRLFQH